MKKFINRSWLFAALLGLSALPAAARNHGGEDRRAEADLIRLDDGLARENSVVLGRAERRVLTETIRAPGEVKLNAYNTSKITNRVPVQIVERHVRLGDKVVKGDAMVTLSSVELAAVQGDLAVARGDWQRVRTLGKEVVSERRYIESRTTYYRLRATALAYGMSAEQVDALDGEGGPGRADGTFRLFAPGAGTIITDDFVEGEYAEAGRVLFMVSDLSSLWVEAQLSPGDVPMVVIGDEVEIYNGEESFPGRVDRFHETLDKVTRTRGVRILVENNDGRLQAGQFVDVAIPIRHGNKVLAVPEGAVVLMDGSPTVFKRDGGGFRPWTVAVGRTRSGWTVIKSGLSTAEEIAVSGVFILKALSQKD